jgi:hypothetical protein
MISSAGLPNGGEPFRSSLGGLRVVEELTQVRWNVSIQACFEWLRRVGPNVFIRGTGGIHSSQEGTAPSKSKVSGATRVAPDFLRRVLLVGRSFLRPELVTNLREGLIVEVGDVIKTSIDSRHFLFS